MIFEKVCEIVSNELSVEKEGLTLETNLTDDLNADSLDAVELIMSLEEEFGISIPDEEAQTLKTIGDIVKCIEKNQ